MKKIAAFLPALFILVFLVTSVFAENNQEFINIGGKQGSGAIPGIPAVDNPNASPGSLVSNGLRIMYILGGIAVLVFIVWGAFDWITSGGDKEKLSGAQKKITNALIGLALLSLSVFIVSLFGEIVGINPLKMGILPTLGEQAVPPQPPPAR